MGQHARDDDGPGDEEEGEGGHLEVASSLPVDLAQPVAEVVEVDVEAGHDGYDCFIIFWAWL